MGVDAGSIYSEIRIQLDALNGDIQKVQAGFDKMGEALGKSSDTTKKKIGDNLQQINLAHVALFAAIGVAIKKFVSGYAEFEQSVANVRSVATGSAEDMKKLEQAAIDAGEATAFSGKQAADALYYLASAGFTATQSVDALDGVLALASATQSDLAFTSETVAAAISQFGLEAKDATKVANVFAAGCAASQATIDKLATSMRYVGPVAATFGISIEEVTGTLSILYNAGFEASQAGTALRGMLADLSNAASPANDKLKALGITFEMVNPALESTTEGVTRLQEIIKNLSPIASNGGKIMEVFGDRAGPAMIKLLQAGEGEIKKYTEVVTGTSAATNAAAIQNDTLQFSLKRVGNAMQAAGNTILKEFAPGMKDANNFIADLLFKVKDLPAPLKVLIGVLLAGAASIAVVNGAAALLGITIGAAMLPIVATIGAISALTAGSILLYRAFNQGISNTINLQKAQKGLEENTDALKTSTDEYKKANDELNTKTKTLNETEKKTLQNRKELASLDATANLEKNIKALEKLTKEQNKQNDSIETFGSQLNKAKEDLDYYKKWMEYLKDLEKKGVRMTAPAIGLPGSDGSAMAVSKAIKNIQDYITAANNRVTTLNTNLANEKIAYSESNKSLQNYINGLAASVSIGALQIEQVEAISETLAKQVRIRAEQIANERLVVELSEKLAAGVIKESDLNKLNNKELIKKIKDQAEIIKLKNAENKAINEGTTLTSEEIDSNKKLQASIEKTTQQLQDLNATDLQKIELDRNRAKAEVDLLQATDKLKTEAKVSIDAYYDALKKKTEAEIADKEATEKSNEIIAQNDQLIKNNIETLKRFNEAQKKKEELKNIDKDLAKQADDYANKLYKLTDVNVDLLAEERQRAIEEIKASKGSADSMEGAIDMVNQYYDALEEKTAFDTFITKMKGLATSTLNSIASMATAFADLANVQAQSEIDTINTVKNAQIKAIDEQLQAQLEAAGLAEQSTIEKLQAELNEAIANNDAELIAEKEKELAKETLIQEAADKKIIIEDQAAEKSAQVAYKAAHTAWILNNLATVANSITAMTQAWKSAPWPWNLPAVTATTIGTGILLAKQAITEPQPPAMIEGGIVMGSQMRGTPVIAAEKGSNELFLNDSSQGEGLLNNFANRIANQIGGGMNVTVILQQDSKETARAVANVMNNGVVTLKQRAIEK
jgi:TP901 family phage tail tape measure protein